MLNKRGRGLAHHVKMEGIYSTLACRTELSIVVSSQLTASQLVGLTKLVSQDAIELSNGASINQRMAAKMISSGVEIAFNDDSPGQ